LEILYFTLVAVGLYLFSDWLLRQIEARRGKPLEHRSIIFFAILLTLAVISFELIQRFAGD
jgi:hypothetical protein